MGDVKVTVLAHHLVIFSVVALADLTEICELGTVVKLKAILFSLDNCLRLFDRNSFRNFIGLGDIVLQEVGNLCLAQRTYVVELCPPDNAVHTERVTTVLGLCALLNSIEADATTVVKVGFVTFLSFILLSFVLLEQIFNAAKILAITLRDLIWALKHRHV